MLRVFRSAGSERGAILVHAGLAFFALLAFTTFVVDMGVMWVSRRQAQNSADAGALAGVTALAFDSYTDRSDNGPAKQSAYTLALRNGIWGQAPNVDITTDVTFPACPDDGTDGCVRVDVYRNQQRNNPLPIIFGQIVGLTSQGVKATATGKVLVGNASNCLKPWVVPDKWQDNSSPLNATFDKYVKQGNTITEIANADVYTAPAGSNPGTGYSLKTDLGALLTLKAGGPQDALTPGWYYPVDLPLMPDGTYQQGGDQYRTNIGTCAGYPVKIGDTLPAENGNMIGPTKQGVDALVAQDPGARFDTGTNTVVNSCAPQCAPISPRIISIALVDPDALSLSMLQTGGKNITLKITNMLGFFINAIDANNNVSGYIMTYPGVAVGTPPIATGFSFLYTPVLIR